MKNLLPAWNTPPKKPDQNRPPPLISVRMTRIPKSPPKLWQRSPPKPWQRPGLQMDSGKTHETAVSDQNGISKTHKTMISNHVLCSEEEVWF